MNAVTTRRDGSAIRKAFSWSYSRLKNFETCPKKHWHVDIQKDVPVEQSEQLDYGNAVHKWLAEFISEGKPLPQHAQADLQEWGDWIRDMPGKKLVEQQLAIDENFGKCEWFGKQAWFRGVADVVVLNGPVALIVDWKTGKIVEDSQQLALTAACVFAHFPEVQKLASVFVWLKEDAKTTATYTRAEMPAMWNNLWPRIQNLKQAHDMTNYPPKPGGLCKRYCPVVKCPHHGG